MFWKWKLHWQILLAMGVGTVVGVIFQMIYGGKPDSSILNIIAAFGTIFMRLLRMVIVPLIFTSIVSGVASVGSGRSIGRLGLKTFSYYIFTSFIAILVGLVIMNIWQPGVGANLPKGDFNPASLQKPGSPVDIILDMIPLNPIAALAKGDMLAIIIFSIFLGVAMIKVKPEYAEPLKKLFDAGFEVMMKITEFVIRLAPLGVFGLITNAVSGVGLELFGTMASYMAAVAMGLSIHFFLVLPGIFFLFTGYSPLLHLRAMAPAFITAFSTSSSNAALPVTIRCVEKNVGVSNRISSFVLPMGATVNMDGTALYECAGVIFISQVLGLGLTFSQQFIIVLTSLLASIGCAGIPSAGLVVIFIVTQSVGFQDAQVAIIIGAMLAVDRPLDMFRTMINVASDTVGAAVVAHSEGEKNLYQNVSD